MRRDLLAAGQKSAKFAGGMGDGDIFRNVAPEGTRDESVPETAAATAPKKIFRPIGEQLLVRRTEQSAVSEILITDTMEKEQPCEGTVLALGKDVTTVSQGDTVVFGKYSGQEFKLNGETLLIMELKEVKGVIVEIHDEVAFRGLGGCTNLTIGRA